MAYPYGMQGAPAVGNGLGGLPRRGVAVASVSGEVVFVTPATYSWVVPVGVTSLCVVAVGGGGGGGDGAAAQTGGNSSFGSYITANGAVTSVGGTGTALSLTVGGGNGGAGVGSSAYGTPGGGGAGGYSGNGGQGNDFSAASVLSVAGGGGSGGGPGTKGGGVALCGQGTSGVSTGIKNGSVDVNSVFLFQQAFGAGGNATNNGNSGGGGGLRYMNDIPVNPSDVISIVVGAGGPSASGIAGTGVSGAVRIIWGRGRSFPLNAA